eukprot:1160172-Pelagomonas_calceolata.AAC.2
MNTSRGNPSPPPPNMMWHDGSSSSSRRHCGTVAHFGTVTMSMGAVVAAGGTVAHCGTVAMWMEQQQQQEALWHTMAMWMGAAAAAAAGGTAAARQCSCSVTLHLPSAPAHMLAYEQLQELQRSLSDIQLTVAMEHGSPSSGSVKSTSSSLQLAA